MNARAGWFLVTALLLGGAAQAAGTTWVGKPLLPLPSLAAGDRFGATLAIGNNLIAVGAYLADTINGKDSGAIFFYAKEGDSWTFRPSLTLKGEAGDQLGFDLAIDSDGTTLLAGAPFARNDRGVRCGAVRRITLPVSPTDSGVTLRPPVCEEGAEFGSSVAVEGCPPTGEGTVCRIEAMGARGEAGRRGRIYRHFGGGELRPLEADVGKGAELGTSLTTAGRWLVAGAPFAAARGIDVAGAVYAFHLGEDPETPRGVQVASGQARTAFGYSVALQDDELAVGAPLEAGLGPRPDAGAVHVFHIGDWTELSASPGEGAGDQFGVAVSWGQYGLFAGARRAASQGAVYPIVGGARGAAMWSPNPDPRARRDAEFGFAVATRGPLLAVGAFMENGSGAAYVFELPPQVATVSFAEESISVDEAAGSVPLSVKFTTDDGKPLRTDVQVGLAFCPRPTDCTAERWTDFRPLGKEPLTIPAGEVSPYTLAVVKILPDSLAEGPEVFTVRLSPRSPAKFEKPRLLRITINDSQLVLSPGPLRTQEQGPPVPFRVRLATAPHDSVTVSLATTDATEGTVSRSSLLFTTADWNQSRTVDLIPVDDPLCDRLQAYAVEVRTTSPGDPSYHGLFRSIAAENEDDEPCPLFSDGFESGTLGKWTGGFSP